MTHQTDVADPLRLAFVCVENASRSQITAAVAETHVRVQGRTDIEIRTGGTDPAGEISPTVLDVMRENGYALLARTPTRISRETLRECDVVDLMGCSVSVDDPTVGVGVRDWGVNDPADADAESVWANSTEIEHCLIELRADLPTEPTNPHTPDTMTERTDTDPIRIAFMCVQNAGRSQMSTAFAERERERRGLEDRVEILTGGTHPADYVHDEVVDVMDDVGFDLVDRTPREITLDELRSCDYVATMGCSVLDVGDVGEDVDIRDWALDDPDGQDLDRVREIRDEIERRVSALFDEIEPTENASS